MRNHPLLLIDRDRVVQFHGLGETGRLFTHSISWTDANGLLWAGTPGAGHGYAVTALGPGWIFDPVARQRRAAAVSRREQAWQQLSAAERTEELAQTVGRVRRGRLAERLLWAIHQRVLTASRSVVRLPDRWLAGFVWGWTSSAWPRHWRQEIRAVLNGLSWLHLLPSDEKLPRPGATTALLTHTADLRGTPTDACDDDCPHRREQRHHHFLVNIGRGFLGVLEECVASESEGVRRYDFPTGPASPGRGTLRQLGRSGRLVTVYLPAELGLPSSKAALSARQRQLLQALVRETTRARRRRRSGATGPEVIGGNQVPDTRGRCFACPFLDVAQTFIGFNGNGCRKGLGYRLGTPGGWLAKAGYGLREVHRFLADLEHLTGILDLTVVAIDPATQECIDLQRLQALTGTRQGQELQERLHVRVYAPADYLDRWNAVFDRHQGRSKGPAVAETIPLTRADLRRIGVTGQALAIALGVHPSFLSRLLNGHKPWPANFQERVTEWLAMGTARDVAPNIVVLRSDSEHEESRGQTSDP